jgi:HK97 gp10 family phage protein
VKIEISHNVGDVSAAMAQYPQLLRQNVAAMLDRGALEVSREARRLAPKAFTTLTNSIRPQVTGEFERTVAPGVAYADYVERGTGPAVGKARYMPNPVSLYAYVKLRARIRITARKGTPQRRDQLTEIRDRAWALARYIYAHGTKPHPFMAPAAKAMESRVAQLLAQGVANAAAGAFKA